MKKLIVLLVFIGLLIPVLAISDSITLTSPETLQVPTSQKLDWYIDRIDASAKLLRVAYRWRGSSGEVISLGTRNPWMTWDCRNRPAIPAFDVGTCLDVADPHPCCTGLGTGSGCPAGTPADTCFSDVFGFTIRTQDVGTGIGVGLRTLIWNKMRQSILTGANNGTFD